MLHPPRQGDDAESIDNPVWTLSPATYLTYDESGILVPTFTLSVRRSAARALTLSSVCLDEFGEKNSYLVDQYRIAATDPLDPPTPLRA